MGHNVSFLGFAVQNCRGYCKKIKHRQPLKSKIKHTVMRCSCFMCFSTVGQCVTVNSIIMEIRIRNRKKKNLLFYKKGLEAVTDKTQSVYEGVIKKKKHPVAAYVFYHQPSLWVWISSDGNDHVSKLLPSVKRGHSSHDHVRAVYLSATRWLPTDRILVCQFNTAERREFRWHWFAFWAL